MSGGSRLVDVGGTIIELVGHHPLIDLVHTELAANRAEALPAEPVGTIEVVEGPLPIPPDSITLGPVSASETRGQIRIGGSGLSYETSLPLDNSPFKARVGVTQRAMPRGIPEGVFRWLNPSFSTPLQSQVPRFIPWVLDAMIFLHCADRAPLHGSAMEHDGEALMLTSTGGAGKSTVGITMIDSGRWNYLCDDMTIVVPGGKIHPYRMNRTIFEHNVSHRPEVIRHLRWKGGIGGRVQWALTGPIHGTGRRRRLPVETVHRPGVFGRPSTPRLIAFLIRSTDEEPIVRKIEAADLAHRSIEIIKFEYPNAITMMRLAGAATGRDIAGPRLAEIQATYERFFADVPRLREIRVPMSGLAPTEIVEILEAEFGA